MACRQNGGLRKAAVHLPGLERPASLGRRPFWQPAATSWSPASTVSANDAGSCWTRRRRSSISEITDTLTLWDHCDGSSDCGHLAQIVDDGQFYRIHPRLVVLLVRRWSGGDFLGPVTKDPTIFGDDRSFGSSGAA